MKSGGDHDGVGAERETDPLVHYCSARVHAPPQHRILVLRGPGECALVQIGRNAAGDDLRSYWSLARRRVAATAARRGPAAAGRLADLPRRPPYPGGPSEDGGWRSDSQNLGNRILGDSVFRGLLRLHGLGLAVVAEPPGVS